MLFVFITSLLLFICLRSIFLLLFRFKKDNRWFAWRQLLCILIVGFISFSIVFLFAVGSTGHYVISDFEEKMGDLTMGIGLVTSILAFIGFFIAVIKGLKFGILAKMNLKQTIEK